MLPINIFYSILECFPYIHLFSFYWGNKSLIFLFNIAFGANQKNLFCLFFYKLSKLSIYIYFKHTPFLSNTLPNSSFRPILICIGVNYTFFPFTNVRFLIFVPITILSTYFNISYLSWNVLFGFTIL